MSTPAARAGHAPDRPSPTLAAPAARALAFLALCGFASLQWMQMLEPAAAQRAGYAVLAAGAAICGLLLAGPAARRGRAPRPRSRSRSRAFALALLGGGVADEQLLPGRWGELAAGHRPRHLRAARRARALPRPRRVDAHGDLPRRHRARGRSPRSSRSGRGARELGLRNVALVLLVTLYAVPAVALDLSSEFLSRRAAGAARRRLPAARAAADHRRRGGGAARRRR